MSRQKIERWENQASCANEMGIPVEHVGASKELNAAGMDGSRIYKDDFKAWYELNKQVVVQYLEDKGKPDLEWDEAELVYRRERARREKAEATLKEIELAEREKRILDKAPTISAIKAVSKAQLFTLNRLSQELPNKLIGQNKTEMGVILYKHLVEEVGKILLDELKQMQDGTNDG